ncbi:hypothetical protein DRN72_02965 [Methanosarcinales archaeon]|nr:MAG: hypothetical protein DRN72_02965 [Methanosarcinales archaeon]
MSMIVIRAKVYPTEEIEKVVQAVENIFILKKAPSITSNLYYLLEWRCEISALKKLHQLLRQQRILETARTVLFKSVRGNKLIFSLNKQAAFAGKVSFGLENEIYGSIDVEIDGDIEKIIDWLAPPTEKGAPLYEREMPT